MSQRAFNFPIRTLTREAGRLHDALADTQIGPAVQRRLPQNFATQFANQIQLVTDSGPTQSDAAGDINALTTQQKKAFAEMNRMTGAARDTAALAFGRGDARLHSEFQVGIHAPQDLNSEIDRAEKVLAASTKYAADLAKHGWIDEDTQALSAAIAALDEADDEQEDASDEKIGITSTRNRDANALYKMCQSLQNAAQLAYPESKIGEIEGLETARQRFLLDEFPPRPKTSDDATETTNPTTPTTGAAN